METNSNQLINKVNAIEDLSDQALFNLCREYGGNAKDWLRKFAGLLPEVYRRALYKKHGCISLHEFAKKLSGMNEETVNKVLNLHRKLLETPILLNLFTSGEVGWSKMEKIAAIANKENEEDLAEKVKSLPADILAIYARQQKKISAIGEEENKAGISQGVVDNEFMIGKTSDHQADSENILDGAIINSGDISDAPLYLTNHKKINFSLSPKTESKLRYVKSLLEQKTARPLSWNQVFAMWPYQASKEQVVIKICPECTKRKGQNSKSRHVPIDVRRILRSKYDNHCAFPCCLKAIAEFHHLRRYALNKNHDPDHIVPLCKHHHDMIHVGLILNEDDPVEKWQIGDTKNVNPKKASIDARVRKYKNLHSQK